jgi:hypothetical protein
MMVVIVARRGIAKAANPTQGVSRIGLTAFGDRAGQRMHSALGRLAASHRVRTKGGFSKRRFRQRGWLWQLS